MEFREIDIKDFRTNPFESIGKEWMLITAQAPVNGKMTANTMTAAWGGMGYLWNKNAAFIFVRPQRYTKEFIDSSTHFSLSFFGGEKKNELTYLGRVSGRDEDKIAASGLHLTYLEDVPCFEEASNVMICRKMYRQTLNENCFIDKDVLNASYPDHDFHDVYVGEIEKIFVK